jgi:malate dehydrogenase (oxaloacetate-decarboxylating)(NADP+)
MQFGSRYIRSRGMYFSAKERGLFSSMIWNWPHNDVQIIVVTDGSRILGLGDLGANGMGIPIGKLALYCAAGGIAPHRVLPVMLDVGTNNQSLLDDPDYIGLREKRLEGPEYVDLVDEFIHAAFQRWPGVVVQFEDFETKKAVPMLERYRDRFRVFNDDIQGTGSVTLSCLMSAARNANSTITQQRILCAGAGSAGLGVCSQLVKGMVNAGMTREDAMAQFCIVDMHGVLGKKDGALRDPHYNGKSAMNRDQMEWVNDNISDGSSLLQAIEEFKPTVLLGLSTVPKLFNEEVIKTMHKYCPTPIIMPMSNPTSRCECTAEEAYMWTNGQAVVASGSPFPAYTHSDGRTLVPSQCNNMYIFPGLGLGASLAGVTSITDTLLYVAAKACTDAMTDEEIGWGRTFPCLSRIRSVSHQIAVAVIKQAQRENLTTKITERDLKKDGSLEAYVSRKMYFPAYVPLVDPRG